MPPGAQPNQQPARQGLSITSLVLGILSILLAIIPFIGGIFGIVAVILGAISMKTRGRKKSLIGIITGCIGLVLSILLSMLVVWVALPALQKSQRDTARKNDVSTGQYSELQKSQRDTSRKSDVSLLATEVSSLQVENNGKLPAAASLSTSKLSQIKSVTDSGEPTTSTATLKIGTNCDNMVSSRSFAVSVMLENGSLYCQGS